MDPKASVLPTTPQRPTIELPIICIKYRSLSVKEGLQDPIARVSLSSFIQECQVSNCKVICKVGMSLS